MGDIDEPNAKRQRTKEVSQNFSSSPRSFITWNCNGFTSRCRWNAADMKRLLEDTGYPDMVCLQEARLKAYNQHTRSRPLQSEYEGAVKDVVDRIFADYHPPVWSLADSKYAGTATFMHRRGGPLDISSQCAFTTDSAIDLLLSKFKLSRSELGIEKRRTPAGDSSNTPAKRVAKQMSMIAFFSPTKQTTASLRSNNNIGSPSSYTTSQHHSEGRFQFFYFTNMDVIQTYVPNNGTKVESFQRRREWDESMMQFLKDRRTILQHSLQTGRPMLWCGDFNVAHTYRDGTHWEQRWDGSTYEFWTDPIKCFVGKKGSAPEDPDDVGIPSFTPAERKRFGEMLSGGDFVDIWRALHPNGVADSKLPRWERPDYSWRGHLAKAGTYNAKFQGKGQRLDYFLLSPSTLIQYVASCKILGYGEKREGHYCGSDHCAGLLQINHDKVGAKE